MWLDQIQIQMTAAQNELVSSLTPKELANLITALEKLLGR